MTSYSRFPLGLWYTTVSPTSLPMKARATGAPIAIRPRLMSASCSPTITYVVDSPLSVSSNVTVQPNETRVLLESFNGSMTSAIAVFASSSRIFASIKPCSSLAAL